jgi:hypothetical protein
MQLHLYLLVFVQNIEYIKKLWNVILVKFLQAPLLLMFARHFMAGPHYATVPWRRRHTGSHKTSSPNRGTTSHLRIKFFHVFIASLRPRSTLLK